MQTKPKNQKEEKKPRNEVAKEKENGDFIDKKRYIHSQQCYKKNNINIKFSSVDQRIHYFITCKEDDMFYAIEEKLYEKYPEYIESENYFMVNGNKINKMKTLLQNKIKNGDMIVLKKIEDDD